MSIDSKHALALLALITWGQLQGCREQPAKRESPRSDQHTEPKISKLAPAPRPAPKTNRTPASASAQAQEPKLAGRTEGCPEGMLRVEGDYCPGLIHKCVKHHPEYERRKNDKNVSERCLEYKKPSRCISKKLVPMSFCMDRYEYPNKKGELPRILTSWVEARKLCERQGKRLCTEEEFNFACEGPEMVPQVTGYIRDPKRCNIDKDYRQPDHSRQLHTYDKCLKTEWCAAEIKRLDQRHKIGATHSCISWAGVVDMNGNVNEWVELPGKESPHRSGLKGGWWGPVRNRCRPHCEVSQGI